MVYVPFDIERLQKVLYTYSKEILSRVVLFIATTIVINHILPFLVWLRVFVCMHGAYYLCTVFRRIATLCPHFFLFLREGLLPCALLGYVILTLSKRKNHFNFYIHEAVKILSQINAVEMVEM